MFRLFSRKVVRLTTPHRSAAPTTEAAGIGNDQEAGGVADIEQKMKALSKENVKKMLAEGKDIKQILTDVFGAKLLSDFELSIQQAEVRNASTPDQKAGKQPQGAESLQKKRRA
jgi:hypothetical protein